jgi:hypothetical protein
MQKDDPALSGVAQRPGQLCGSGEHPEAALGIGIFEGIALFWLPDDQGWLG